MRIICLTKTETIRIQREESSNKEDRVVTSTNTLRSELFAAKLVLSRPLLGGKCHDRG